MRLCGDDSFFYNPYRFFAPKELLNREMKKRDLLIASCGNILEWFDFGLFIYLAPIIGQQFFPTHSPHGATLAAFGVFAAGFICRPLGGILFGYLGDRRGRVEGLRSSIIVMTFATLLIGLLPSYHTIGIFSPLLFTALRLIQGLSVGGEYSGVMIYLAESAPSHRRGFFTSFAAIGSNLGFLLATISALCLELAFPSFAINSWIWRVPFILGGILGLSIFYYRLQLLETPSYLFLKASHEIKKQPLLAALRYFPKKLLKILGLTCMGSTFYYVFFGYMSNYLSQHVGMSLHTIFSLQAVSLVFMLVLIPLAGLCGDRYGRKRMLCIAALGIIFLTIPCFYLLQEKTIISILTAFSIAAVLSALEQGNNLATFVENCPASVRYSGIAFAFNLGNAIFGGTAPILVSVLTMTWGNFAPAYYLMGMTMISLAVIMTLQANSQVNDLGEFSTDLATDDEVRP